MALLDARDEARRLSDDVLQQLGQASGLGGGARRGYRGLGGGGDDSTNVAATMSQLLREIELKVGVAYSCMGEYGRR